MARPRNGEHVDGGGSTRKGFRALASLARGGTPMSYALARGRVMIVASCSARHCGTGIRREGEERLRAGLPSQDHRMIRRTNRATARMIKYRMMSRSIVFVALPALRAARVKYSDRARRVTMPKDSALADLRRSWSVGTPRAYWTRNHTDAGAGTTRLSDRRRGTRSRLQGPKTRGGASSRSRNVRPQRRSRRRLLRRIGRQG